MTSLATHTGKQIEVGGIWIDRIAEDRIVECWGVIERVGVLHQLGVIPVLQRALQI
jgi:predicted ester cyclase